MKHREQNKSPVSCGTPSYGLIHVTGILKRTGEKWIHTKSRRKIGPNCSNSDENYNHITPSSINPQKKHEENYKAHHKQIAQNR